MALPSEKRRRSNRFPSPFSSGGFLDDLFQNIEDSFFRGFNGLGRMGNTDIYEKDGKLHYDLELPGLTKDQINIWAKNNQLVVTGEIEQEEEKEEDNYLSRGRRYGRFRRTLPFPEEIGDPEKFSARFENGVLRITAELSEALGEEKAIDVEIE